ncbi:MAG: PD-(D/E)XK motif protein [Melioribacteraceae bacterium]|nr:PD-(D/E)XK motif protein [Melioribacteraceae bacterium]
MTDKTRNPWENMTDSTRRRVDSETKHNIFWITDMYGKYGFCLYTDKLFSNSTALGTLKGINIIKKNSTNRGELFLILNRKEDWQIFNTLCEDLIAVAHRFENDEKMISAVEVRLQRWQELLKKNREKELTVELQMGLFTELLTLRDIVAKKYGMKNAVLSWVGPEGDKQDFLLEDAAIEVKSHRTSKGPIAHISSPNQLSCEKIPLYLISYGLTQVENGLTVEDIATSIRLNLEEDAIESVELFEAKLSDYGYTPEFINEPLSRFLVDFRRIYTVTPDFPKIPLDLIKSQIVTLKYSIDLSKCSEYEVEVSNIFS